MSGTGIAYAEAMSGTEVGVHTGVRCSPRYAGTDLSRVCYPELSRVCCTERDTGGTETGMLYASCGASVLRWACWYNSAVLREAC
eukprot:1913131-Rhodomonas_salina.1